MGKERIQTKSSIINQNTTSKYYNDFESLFNAACNAGLIPKPGNKTVYLNRVSRYNNSFNTWVRNAGKITNPHKDKISEKEYLKTLNSEIFKEFLQYLEQIVKDQEREENLIWKGKPKPENKKFAAKFFALFHWIKIEMGRAKHFERDENGEYKRTEIESFAKNHYPNCSAQGFYRVFRNLDISNKVAIAKEYGRGYKDKLIAISDNDNELLTHLKSYPN